MICLDLELGGCLYPLIAPPGVLGVDGRSHALAQLKLCFYVVVHHWKCWLPSSQVLSLFANKAIKRNVLIKIKKKSLFHKEDLKV